MIPGGSAIVHASPPPAPLSLPEIKEWAALFVQSGLFKGVSDVAKAIVKIQAGQEIGVPPYAAMRGFDIIEGKPAPNAGLTASLIRRSGRYDYRVTESTATACRIEWHYHGEAIGETSFTIEEARAAGLAGKQVWKSYASDMLFARALTRGARRFCSDVFLGSVYSAEELGADPALPADTDSDAPTHAVNGHRAAAPQIAAQDEPPIEAEFGPAPESVDPAEFAGWTILIGEAATFPAVFGVVRQIVDTETNPFRAGGALRIAARKMMSLVPEDVPESALPKTIEAFQYVATNLDPAAGIVFAAAAQHADHDACQAEVTTILDELRTLVPAKLAEVAP